MFVGSCTFRCPRLENLWRRSMLNFAWSIALPFELEYDCCSVEGLRLGKWGSSRDWPGNKCWYYGVIQWASSCILSDVVHYVRVTHGLWSLENVDIRQCRFRVDFLCYVVLSSPSCYFLGFIFCISAWKNKYSPNFAPEYIPHYSSKRSQLGFANIFLSQIKVFAGQRATYF